MAEPVPFVDQFASAEPMLGGAEHLHALRTGALARYRAAGLPTRAVEAWKYTGLEGLAALGLVPAATAATPRVSVPEAAIAAVDSHRAVFVNGRFDPAQSRLDALPQGVVVESLAALIARDPVAAERALAGEADGLPLAALNTAFAADGLVLDLAPGSALDRPLHVISIGGAVDESAVAFHPRHLIRLAPDARATVIESHVGSAGYFANAVVDIDVGAGATLNHIRCRTRRRSRSMSRSCGSRSPRARPTRASCCRPARGWRATSCVPGSTAPTPNAG